MRLVKNKPEYWEFIRNLRNDDEVRTGFIVQDYITEENQKNYMGTYNDRYYICLKNNKPVGYIGDMNLDIRLAVLPDEQGSGVGKFMLTEFMKIRPGAYAKVLLGNEKSRRLFISAGFKETHRNDQFYYFVKR